MTNRPEFGEMFGGFLLEFGGQNILVDCGTVTGGPSLVANLKAILGQKPLDLVYLTHAHLDHSGGLGEIFKAYPKALAVCHAKGLAHLAKPERLWLSTKEVMGELADMYGQPRPVDPTRLIPHDQYESPGLKILLTPGHAAHHLSYRFGDLLFAGEAVGCPYYSGAQFHCRPATPPRYFPETTLASLDLLDHEPVSLAYFGHTHEIGPLKPTISAYRRQLKLWDEILKPDYLAAPQDVDLKELAITLTEGLFERDPDLRPLLALPAEALGVEKYFMRNCVDGFLGYYQELSRKTSA
jgi:glyoxylase-like metal-dependent hydrolase (beta-lactamase superfamily II)